MALRHVIKLRIESNNGTTLPQLMVAIQTSGNDAFSARLGRDDAQSAFRFRVLTAAIQEAWINGVPMRPIIDLGQVTGVTGISKGKSRSCARRSTDNLA